MARSTLTKRQRPPRQTVEKGEPDRLDLGTVTLPKGTPVTATTLAGKPLVGTLTGVDYRDGVPHTATLWVVDGVGRYQRAAARSVYVETVSPL